MLATVLLNTLLAIVWMLLLGDISLAAFAVGYLVGLGILALLDAALTPPLHTRRIFATFGLLGRFAIDVILANVEVASQVLRPRLAVRPGVFTLPTELRSNLEITVLASMITLTPGTLAVDVAPDRSVLYVHALDLPDPDAARQRIKERYERPILFISRYGRYPEA